MTIKSLLLLLLFSSSLLNAQVIPGRWENVDSLPSGQQIIVTLRAGVEPLTSHSCNLFSPLL